MAPPSASSSEIWGDRPAMLLQSSKPPPAPLVHAPAQTSVAHTTGSWCHACGLCLRVSTLLHCCSCAGVGPKHKAGETLHALSVEKEGCPTAPTERSSEHELHARANGASATQISAERVGAHSAA